MKNKRQNAFTLAEVLITLGIIGVVAALTLPTLIQNYQKKETATRLRKIYSEMAQALQLAEAEHGEMSTWDFGGCEDDLCTTKYFFDNYLKLKFSKKCIPTTAECWSTPYHPDGELSSFRSNKSGGFFSAIVDSGYSLFSKIGTRSKTAINNILLDINGPQKGPNKFGRDVFMFVIRFDNKFPNFYLQRGGEEKCSKDCSGLSDKNHCGVSCGNRIELNGWEIPDDYPW